MSHSIVDLAIELHNFIMGKNSDVLSTLAPIESSNISTRVYEVGDNLILDEVMYDVISPIAVGDVLSASNIEASDKVMDVIHTKSDKPIMITRILLPGVTELTFPVTDTGTVFVDFFTDTGIPYTDISVNSLEDTVTLTFEPQEENVNVYCLIQSL